MDLLLPRERSPTLREVLHPLPWDPRNRALMLEWHGLLHEEMADFVATVTLLMLISSTVTFLITTFLPITGVQLLTLLLTSLTPAAPPRALTTTSPLRTPYL
jgi:hypothetical protein